MKKFIDVMIDLETLGLKPGCKILSIGATAFSLESIELNNKFIFYEFADRKQQLGLNEDPKTLAWWESKNKDTYAEALSGTKPLVQVLIEFSQYLLEFHTLDTSVRPWSKSASFDLEILKYAFDLYDISIPWDFRNEMCFRTLESLYSQIKADSIEGMKKHNALHDAIYQANHAMKILSYIRDSYTVYDETFPRDSDLMD